MAFMIYDILRLVLDVAFYVMIVQVIMSWLLNFNVLNYGQPFVRGLWDGLNRLLEPVYRPIRSLLPDTRPLDLAPLVAFILLIALRDIVLPTLFGLR